MQLQSAFFEVGFQCLYICYILVTLQGLKLGLLLDSVGIMMVIILMTYYSLQDKLGWLIPSFC